MSGKEGFSGGGGVPQAVTNKHHQGLDKGVPVQPRVACTAELQIEVHVTRLVMLDDLQGALSSSRRYAVVSSKRALVCQCARPL